MDLLDRLVCSRRPLGYDLGMKTAISVPDRIFAEAERLARRLKVAKPDLHGGRDRIHPASRS